MRNYYRTTGKLEYNNYKVYNDFDEFCKKCDLIVANRLNDELLQIKDKVYTRDIFHKD